MFKLSNLEFLEIVEPDNSSSVKGGYILVENVWSECELIDSPYRICRGIGYEEGPQIVINEAKSLQEVISFDGSSLKGFEQ